MILFVIIVHMVIFIFRKVLVSFGGPPAATLGKSLSVSLLQKRGKSAIFNFTINIVGIIIGINMIIIGWCCY